MLSRRTLLKQTSALAALATLPAFAPDMLAQDPIAATYRNAIVLDTLTFVEPTFNPAPALAAGLTGGVLDIVVPTRDFEHAVPSLDAWNRAFHRPGSRLMPILKGADFAEAKRLRKFAIVLNCQDASILGTPTYANGPDNIDNLHFLYGKGLRVLQLTYTGNNGLGSGYSEIEDGGLARLGLAVTEEMNKLGMLVDVSHSSENTTLDAIAHSTRPIAVTHSGCFSLYPDKRNKSDLVIRKLADKGGYMGIYNMTLWMTTQPTSSVETICDHIDHAVKIGGIDLPGFGSDHEVLGDARPQAVKVASMQDFAARNKGFPGGEPIEHHVTASDLDGPDRLRVIAESLDRRKYTSSGIEKILGGNFVRTFTGACG